MSKIDDKIKNFEKLDKNNKIEKLKSMLDIIKGDWDLFDDLYNLIVWLWENISEELLISIYTMIEKAIENINSDKLKEDIWNLDKIRKKLNKLKEMEELERKNENPDDLLNNL